MKKRLIAGCLMVAAMVLLAACGALSDAAKLEDYEFGNDKIPTVNSQVGERKVTGVETGTNNGTQQKQYTYQSESVFDDILTYTLFLRDNGWIVTQEYDLSVSPGSAQLAKESEDAGQILVLSIAYEGNQYAIKITKMEGTLTTN